MKNSVELYTPRQTDNEFTLGARWIVPVERPILENGSVTIRNGLISRITANGRKHANHDLGQVAITPALVNAHTHLEFSGRTQPIGYPGIPITDWIPQVVRWRMSQTTAETLAALKQGLKLSRAAGVGAIGEIATSPWHRQIDLPDEIFLTWFAERLGTNPVEAADKVTQGKDWLAGCDNARLTGGISPHAPYSLSPDLFRMLIDWAVQDRRPVAMHLAESQQELEFIRSGQGPFREMFTNMGIDVSAAGQGNPALQVADYLRALGKTSNALVVHGNYLSNEELRLMAGQSNMNLVFCPRTHQFFGHQNYPLELAIKLGINVAVGTDSLASNPDLCLLDELKTIAGLFPEIDPEIIFRMGTLNGAKALQCDQHLGSLTSGKQAKLLVCSLDDPDDLWGSLLGQVDSPRM